MPSSSDSQSMYLACAIMNMPTTTSGGAVAMAGTALNTGAKGSVTMKQTATVTAVRPVRPPSWMPAPVMELPLARR